MKVTIYLNRVIVDYSVALNRAIDYFKKHGIELDIETKVSNIYGLKSKKNSVQYGQRWLIGHVSPESESDITIFAFNGREFPIDKFPTSETYIQSSKVYINLLTDDRLTDEELYLTIIHEMMHALKSYLIAKYSIVVDDCMDILVRNGQELPYYNNNKPDSPDSNFSEMWKRLSPYMSKFGSFSKPIVTITRSPSNGETPGVLEARNGGAIFHCKSLELPYLNNSKNISCIPVGEYTVKYTFSPRKLKYTYEVQNVPGRSGIRIHIGNYAKGKKVDTDGCILLGATFADINGDKNIDITSSSVTINAFEGFMGKKDFTLIIK